MRRICPTRVLASLAIAAAAVVVATPKAGAGPVDDYMARVKPVLAKRCYACHGALQQKAGLRLDTAASIVQGGKGGAVVEPGRADESTLVDRLTEPDEALRMPPEGEPLSAAEIEAVRGWITAGAPASEGEPPQADPRDHWSFRPPVRAANPRVDGVAAANPVDAFLGEARSSRGLTPAPRADRATLLRRLSIDLTGLAPTVEELRGFLTDEAADAYERAVDRLLASPRYGERWGRHWMDVWRYSDWAGYQAEVRESQPHIWRWRDWIVEMLNRDTGYDRMVVAMLAGDEAAPDDPDTLRATGYLVRSWYKFNRNTWLQNTVEHSGKAFLGLTFNCARCHDHKYDPISQADYYRLRAFFEPHDIRVDRVPGVRETSRDGLVRVQDVHADRPTFLFVRGEESRPAKDRPLTPGLPAFLGPMPEIRPVALPASAAYPGLLSRIRAEDRAAADAEVARAREQLDAARKAADAAREARTADLARLDAGPADRAEVDRKLSAADRTEASARLGLEAARARRLALEARIAADDARYADPPDSKRADIQAMAAARAERAAGLAAAEERLARASAALTDHREAQPAAAVPPSPDALAKAEVEARKAVDSARLALGKLAREYAPLVPTNPATSTGRRLALARWIVDRGNPLAARVAVNHVWLRHFGRPLVPTVFDFGVNGTAPSHPELLDALAVDFMESGWSLKALHRRIVTSEAYQMRSWAPPGDPSAAVDPENRLYWRMNPRRLEAEAVRDNVLHVAGSLDLAMGGVEIDHAKGLEIPRRSLYFRHAAEKQVLFLQLFDAASVSSCYRRDESIVPQQALALANSPLAIGQARLLAARLSADSGPADDAGFVASAFERVLQRPATPEERTACLDYLDAQARRLAAGPAGLTPFAEASAVKPPPAPDARQRAREGLVHVLFNHNDFITIR